MYTLSDFDFHLPPELIAQMPLPDRSASRLLQVENMRLVDRSFTDIVDLVQPGDLMIFNDTRVLKARLFGSKATGGKIEVLIERVLDDRTVLAQVRASKTPRPGMRLTLANAFDVEVGERAGEFFTLRFPDDVLTLLEQHGRLPLPPYITRDADSPDDERYQAVYARHQGAVAAPTAGLHFTDAQLDALDRKSVV